MIVLALVVLLFVTAFTIGGRAPTRPLPRGPAMSSSHNQWNASYPVIDYPTAAPRLDPENDYSGPNEYKVYP